MSAPLLLAAFAAFQAATPISPRALPNNVSIPNIAPTDVVYPGCPVPPTSFGHVWYIDAVNGHSQVADGSGDPGGGDGSQAHPWKSLLALFGAKIAGSLSPIPGYTTMLLSTNPHSIYPVGPIHPGDEVILMSGNYGKISAGDSNSPLAEVVNNPALTIAAGPGQTPVLSYIEFSALSGFVFNGLTIQSQNDDGRALVSIKDGAIPGYTATNIVLENMNISSAPVATALTWNISQWNANARPGVFFASSDGLGAAQTCSSLTNSTVQVVNGGQSISMISNNSLVQNVNLGYWTNGGIGYTANNVAILGNYIHDIFQANGGGNGYGVQGGNGILTNVPQFNNIYIARNKIIGQIDPALTVAAQSGGIFTSSGEWGNVSIFDNLIAVDGCQGVNTGNVHNGFVANNSVIDGLITAFEQGCVLSITVGQEHSGSTGPVGTPPSNVRIFNNVAPFYSYTGNNVQADHNVSTALTQTNPNGSTQPAVPYFYYSDFPVPQVMRQPVVAGSVYNAPADSGVGNVIDGIGQANEFTAVPAAGSTPMSPAPNWTPKSGSPMKTAGGAVLISPLTDFNRVPFAPPLSRGGLN